MDPKKQIPLAHVHSFRAKDKLWTKVKAKAAKKGLRPSEGIVEALEKWVEEK